VGTDWAAATVGEGVDEAATTEATNDGEGELSGSGSGCLLCSRQSLPSVNTRDQSLEGEEKISKATGCVR